VRAGVVEVLPLEQHAHTELVGEPVALGEGRRAAGIVPEQVVEAQAERRVGPGLPEGNLELLACGYEGLGDETPAELSETALGRGVSERHRLEVTPAMTQGPNREPHSPGDSPGGCVLFPVVVVDPEHRLAIDVDLDGVALVVVELARLGRVDEAHDLDGVLLPW
jgi:hypothetical protein